LNHQGTKAQRNPCSLCEEKFFKLQIQTRDSFRLPSWFFKHLQKDFLGVLVPWWLMMNTPKKDPIWPK
jgi:hypothetical protein